MGTSEPKHRRNISKSSRPRSSTKGPLDAPDDPLSADSLNSATGSRLSSPVGTGIFPGTSLSALDPLTLDDLPAALGKDLSYLLRSDIYHPVSQINVPPALRSEFFTPSQDEPLSSLLNTLERLLVDGHFLVGAHLCATILTSARIGPTHIKLILTIFYTRLACLELSGYAILAAQESKALEDLSSAFYYVDSDFETPEAGPDNSHENYTHIVPWPLRVLAVRLQSIGFGDPRRGIGGLYELGLEARRRIMRPNTGSAEREIWKERLSDLGIRSVNALVEMGDLDAARRSLDNLSASRPGSQINGMRKTLLSLRIGDLEAAKKACSESGESGEAMLKPLLSMADGRYADAVAEWRALLENESRRSDRAIIAQNLAVCLLYTGQLNEARPLLESLIAENQSFASLTFNLSTIYELCSDKSGTLKMQLADAISKQPVSGDANVDRPNSDFKL